ncbi:DUF3105 domain-containing protein [Deinococcus cellulosilyticus]|uniref:DUF3105 domain-containing protein n=2 Tax=Deinococcus cellulosilyticus TaxID=401558 RepID=A0A511N165_DEIC1|nr:DUF3105 domain-containing protein [Deinococcus cellulosilyticus]GEM46633.1 hypothetical protein DC3_22680 [Deinococcus cellulosilyticus NBRC 106333 = KACC 11606]
MKAPQMIPLLIGLTLLASCNTKTSSIEGVETFTVAAGHKEGKLEYKQTPPAGGEHNPTWQNCGIYQSPIYNEYGVHSMEHGAVWITHQPDLSAEEINTLADAMKGNSHVLMSPYPDLKSKVVVSAWGKQLKLDSVSDVRLVEFIRTYAQSPDAPEPGAPCSGAYSGVQ